MVDSEAEIYLTISTLGLLYEIEPMTAEYTQGSWQLTHQLLFDSLLRFCTLFSLAEPPSSVASLPSKGKILDQLTENASDALASPKMIVFNPKIRHV